MESERQNGRRSRLRILALAAVLATPGAFAHAEPLIPFVWDPVERLTTPDLQDFKQVRFVTTTDFPPFNSIDGAGNLVGYNIDLAREICRKLAILDRCQIQALPFTEIPSAIANGQAEAAMAGIGISPETREILAFTRPYLPLPARFAMHAGQKFDPSDAAALSGLRIGVMAGSAHEKMLRDLFPKVHVVTFSKMIWLTDELANQKLDGVFGDGMRLSKWLADAGTKGCCSFAGKAYIAPEYLGFGLAIAVDKMHPDLAAAFDSALSELERNGTTAELYLKYFPIGFF